VKRLKKGAHGYRAVATTQATSNERVRMGKASAWLRFGVHCCEAFLTWSVNYGEMEEQKTTHEQRDRNASVAVLPLVT
jgi:hypothetical protein